MRLRPGTLLSVCAVAVIVSLPVRLAAQDSLDAARQLYASADYRGALSMLDTLLAGSPASYDRQSIDLYRAFCMVALGNTKEAYAAIEAMISREPLYRPNMEDVPPRIRTVFTEARKRVLPSIIQQRYRLARTAFDQQDYKAATEGFMQILLALSDPDIADVAGQSPLADLGVLATNFNDLAVRAMTPPAAPRTEPPPPPIQPAVIPLRTEIYTADDKDVVEPVVVRQNLPPFPGRSPIARRGLLDVVIDITGAVESAILVEPLSAAYDRVVLATARDWVYQPARRDGVPVKYKKRIAIVVSAGTAQ